MRPRHRVRLDGEMSAARREGSVSKRTLVERTVRKSSPVRPPGGCAMLSRLAVFAALIALAGVSAVPTPLRDPRPSVAPVGSRTDATPRSPVRFEENKGQMDSRVQFIAHSPRGSALLNSTGAYLFS